jgi:hypothetical protein
MRLNEPIHFLLKFNPKGITLLLPLQRMVVGSGYRAPLPSPEKISR